MKLSQNQVEEIQQSFLSGDYSTETHVQKLASAGFDKEVAERLVLNEVKAFRQRVFNETFNRQKNEEHREGAFLVAFMVAIVGPVFDITSPLWYLIAMLIGGAAGYYGYKNKPAAGISGAVTFVLLFPFMYRFYFAGRTSYINLELVIPLLIAAVPAFLLLLIVSKVFYSDNDD